MNRFWLSFLCLVMVVFSSPSHAQLNIIITEGVDNATPIAVVPFKFDGEGFFPGEITDVVVADLRRSGKFNPVSMAQMPQFPNTDSEVDYDTWVDKGINTIVVGSVTEVGNQRYRIDYELIDTLRGSQATLDAQSLRDGQLVQSRTHVIAARSLTVSGSEFRQFAHRIADVIYEKLTGQKGAF